MENLSNERESSPSAGTKRKVEDVVFERTLPLDKLTFYWRMPLRPLVNIISAWLIFDRLGLQCKEDYIVSVFQHNTSIVAACRLDKEKISEAGGEYWCSNAANIGIQPMSLFSLLNKVSSSITHVEIALFNGSASLNVIVGPWNHEMSLTFMDVYRHTRPPVYDKHGTYTLCPSSFLNHLTQVRNVPKHRASREMQVQLDFTQEGIVVATGHNAADPNSKSSCLLAFGPSKSRKNYDTTAVKNIENFLKPVKQVFDLRILQSIIKPASLLTNQITIDVAEDKPLQIHYTLPGGVSRFYVADQIDAA